MYYLVTFLFLVSFICLQCHVESLEELPDALINGYNDRVRGSDFEEKEIENLERRLLEKASHHGNNENTDDRSNDKPEPQAQNKFYVVDAKTDDTIKLQAAGNAQPVKQGKPIDDDVGSMNNIIFITVVAGCSIAGLVGLVVAGVCWYRLQKNVKAVSEAEYPAYGVTGPSREKVTSPGDRKLAQSAQMYHYQHQKQQMLAMERANGDLGGHGSDVDSEEENEEGDYTVYECPGLAPTGEMEVKNPLFNDDTPGNTNGEEGGRD